MFETLDLKQYVSKHHFAQDSAELRSDLLDAQFELLEQGRFPVILVLAGFDAVQRSQTVKRLTGWLDSRHVRLFGSLDITEHAPKRPRLWPFWQNLPRRGRIGIFLTSWYEEPFRLALQGKLSAQVYHQRLEDNARFEKLLADDGALILKFVYVQSREEDLKDFEGIRKRRGPPLKETKSDRDLLRFLQKDYDEGLGALQAMVHASNTAHAPWIPVASNDARHCEITTGRILLTALRDHLSAPVKKPPVSPPVPVTPGHTVLDRLDLTASLKEPDYRRQLKAKRRALTDLTLDKRFEDRALVVVFEGSDAAGKGGAIRRVVRALDPRMMRVIPVGAPSDEEARYHYLWRFWRDVPRRGEITLFDRSWYGRVLVERVEGYAEDADWQRAYDEIRGFEGELAASGIIVQKFWLSIDADEQLRRFRERENTPHKRRKITPEDWRNRERRDDYRVAVHDMVTQTHTDDAPWTLVEANDKRFARIRILDTLIARMSQALEREG